MKRVALLIAGAGSLRAGAAFAAENPNLAPQGVIGGASKSSRVTDGIVPAIGSRGTVGGTHGSVATAQFAAACGDSAMKDVTNVTTISAASAATERRTHMRQKRLSIVTMACAWLCLLFLCCASDAHGADTSPLLDVAGTPSITTPVVTLSWTAAADSTDVNSHTVLRRRMGEEAWATLTSALPANAAGYADGTAEIAIAYEYKVMRWNKNGTVMATGYLAGGTHVPMTDDRGKLVLIVDQTMAAALPTEITQLQQDLVGDGWGGDPA